MVHSAFLLDLVGNHLVALVEEQDAELLLGFEAHGGPAIVQHLLPRAKQRAFQHLAAHQP